MTECARSLARACVRGAFNRLTNFHEFVRGQEHTVLKLCMITEFRKMQFSYGSCFVRRKQEHGGSAEILI
jgi:hypothetical protein